MQAATAKAKTEQPEPVCTALELWKAVAALRVGLNPPPASGGPWMAGCDIDGHVEAAIGDTPVEAVEALLRRIGGENG